MEFTEKLADIKKILFGSEEEEQVFADYKTTDGVILRCDELSEGATVSIISEDGEVVSGAASYVLEDGRTVEVSEEGAIVSIVDAEEEVEELKEEVMQEDEVNPMDERISKIENGLKEILGLFDKQVENFSKDVDLSKQLEDLKAEFEAFKSAPADGEIEVKKAMPKVNSKEDKLRAIAKFRNNAK
tara:strand:+ start:292 stop:849 length:558 start_codon:yes stop_codon:yes gene_type:complete